MVINIPSQKNIEHINAFTAIANMIVVVDLQKRQESGVATCSSYVG